MAHKALLIEVVASPKPGLVDRFNCGAHTDMDLFTFINSATAIHPYLFRCAQAGGQSKTLDGLFLRLRKYGVEAEKAMLLATHGVNTHKGAIFSMGLVTAAAGYGMEHGGTTPFHISKICSELCEGLVEQDLVSKQESKLNKQTSGQLLFAQYGITGVRGEAQKGFPTVMKRSLPIFQTLMEEGLSINDCCVQTLLHLITQTRDTNILSRTGLKGLSFAQEYAKKVLEQGGILNGVDIVEAMDREFIARNISPGGCADLLSVTCFLYLLQTNGYFANTYF
ncbi:triphosphoribosyl-dephospho-CoA synthase CitG [Desulfosporosinus sp. Sb-LF]|uniref:triphosphoribosyl-dephospho-CoA synthase CitG n=1 Tax=Desulfosporosinus sp. Sb-LF TaxID=2560027 RepID=UPI001FB0BA98|nr:triphosphoribosyl-dephospho-CoA synthase CitG [Desulfosporosinus sp. Sb-LF]